MIDDFTNGVATSFESMDLSGAICMNPGKIMSQGAEYVDKVVAFSGRRWAGVTIDANHLTKRALDLAVEPGIANVEQRAALQWIQAYGSQKGVAVKVLEMR